MNVTPSLSEFIQKWQGGKHQVVWTRLVSDLETPVSAMLKLGKGKPFSFLLESIEGGAIRGRYSIIGREPDVIWRCRDGKAEINRDALHNHEAYTPALRPPLEDLRELLNACRIDDPDQPQPMAAGLFGYLGYGMVRFMERLPEPPPSGIEVPDAIFVRPTLLTIFDQIENCFTLVTPVWFDAGINSEDAYKKATERLHVALQDLACALPLQPAVMAQAPDAGEAKSNMTEPGFVAMVEHAKEYIRAGDAFQVVLSQRFCLPFDLPPFSLYRAVRRLDPSPFLFFFDFKDFSVVGTSPEILVRVRDNKVTIRPIAGTRPRGLDNRTDAELSAELLADPKELAEHLMLVDLGRNDVGRVAKTGTVRVTERNIIEYYRHVMHIVSNVEGDLAPGLSSLDALMAGFPAGTVSGAPKIRAMEIIAELEPDRRGIYAGCIGYFGSNGSMDSCIAIRTAVVKDGYVHVQAGAGIVYDSDPRSEYRESAAKAQGLLRAATIAVQER
jgi:anthranilate synthase component I